MLYQKLPDASWKALSVFSSDQLMRSCQIEQGRDFAIIVTNKAGKCKRSIRKKVDVEFEIIDFMTHPIDDSFHLLPHEVCVHLVNVKADLFPDIALE